MLAHIIVDKARLALGDTKEERWSSDRLLDLVDEAQKDICLNTSMFRREAYIPLVVGNFMYDLPEDVLLVHRIETLTQKTPFATKDDFDNTSTTWRTQEGEIVTHILKDSIPMNKVEVYPIPSGDMFYIPTYQGIQMDIDTKLIMQDVEGVITAMGDGTDFATMDSVLGVYTGSVVDISVTAVDANPEETIWGVFVDYYTIDVDAPLTAQHVDWAARPMGVASEVGISQNQDIVDIELFGVITELDMNSGYMSDAWGAVASVIAGESVLKVFYTAIPPSISTNNAPLILSNIWATALKYYVAGYALMDDNDAGNIARGKEFISRYGRELQRAMVLSTKEMHDDTGARVTQYQTPFRR